MTTIIKFIPSLLTDILKGKKVEIAPVGGAGWTGVRFGTVKTVIEGINGGIQIHFTDGDFCDINPIGAATIKYSTDE